MFPITVPILDSSDLFDFDDYPINCEELQELDADELEIMFNNIRDVDQVQLKTSSHLSRLMENDPTGRMTRHIGLNKATVNLQGILRLPPLQIAPTGTRTRTAFASSFALSFASSFVPDISTVITKDHHPTVIDSRLNYEPTANEPSNSFPILCEPIKVCKGCLKEFKSLSLHKCKNDLQKKIKVASSVLKPRVKPDKKLSIKGSNSAAFRGKLHRICAYCSKIYTSKLSFEKHVAKCSKLAPAVPSQPQVKVPVRCNPIEVCKGCMRSFKVLSLHKCKGIVKKEAEAVSKVQKPRSTDPTQLRSE